MPTPESVTANQPRPDSTPAERRAQRRADIADRRRKVAKLVLQKVQQLDIAAMLNVSPATVSGDMKVTRAGWQVEAQHSVEQHIAQELATYNDDERYWRTEMLRAGADMELRLKMYDRVLKIMEHRRKLLGLDAPIRLELARQEARKLAEEFGLDADALVRLAEEIVAGKVK